ncbi:MAG: M14 family zinc carboxypeptidase, partial [Planctomycetota bacterium]
MRLHHALTVAVLVSIPLLNGCRVAPAQRYSDPAELPDAWRLHAERTDFVETGTYNEAVAFCERLAAASPYVRYMTFGISGEGRPLPLLVVSKQRAFSPERRAALVARGPARPLVLIQNCIHAGECEGKDATFMLVRDMLLAARCPAVLERVDLLVMPIFNADGHERRSPFNRINQNGP